MSKLDDIRKMFYETMERISLLSMDDPSQSLASAQAMAKWAMAEHDRLLQIEGLDKEVEK
jgi:hypothetical protein